MADAVDDRDLVAKSVRPVGPQAIPPRSGDAMRRLADLTYPLIPDGESRCLSVGRGITLSGEVNSCDKLLIEGSVDAKLTNCRAIEIAESGLFKGSTTIDEAEIRGRFEGDLIVRNRLLIKATGRVSGTISYGQIEIECGGQIFGDIQAQPAGELGRAPLPGGFAAFIPDDRSGKLICAGAQPTVAAKKPVARARGQWSGPAGVWFASWRTASVIRRHTASPL